jgi:RNA recognition motif-containing protein
MNMYVSNLSPGTTQDQLRKVFQAHGTVSSVSLQRTLMRGRHGAGVPYGIGIVKMPDKAQAMAALAALHHHELDGHSLTVQAARPIGARRLRRK